jgi:hypothetical protein
MHTEQNYPATARTVETARPRLKARTVAKPSRKPPFDVERAIRKVMPSVDAVLEENSDEDRTIFLREIIDTLTRMM